MQSVFDEIKKAEERIRPHVLRTPLLSAPYLSELTGANVYIKMESEQYTGSFKSRGSANKILSLAKEAKARGVVTASTGNHGRGVARAAQMSDVQCIVFLPEQASPDKESAIRRYGVETRRFGTDSLFTEVHAKQFARANGMTWISPYNDVKVIAGQGTIACELFEQLPDIDCVLASVGGGGLISGIGSYFKVKKPEVEIVGCQPENSAEMYLSLQAGHIIEPVGKATLSDTSAGGVEDGSITYNICREVVDHFCLVSEPAIAAAMRLSIEQLNKTIEGAAGVTIASLLQEKERYKGKNVVLIICGGNVSSEVIRKILSS